MYFCRVYPVHHFWINYFVICMIYELCLARYSCIYFKFYRYDELSSTKLLLLPEALKAKKLKVQGMIARPILFSFSSINPCLIVSWWGKINQFPYNFGRVFLCLFVGWLVSLFVSYHCKFLRLLYIQHYTCKNMSPRYLRSLHWRHSYGCRCYTRPGLQQFNATLNILCNLN